MFAIVMLSIYRSFLFYTLSMIGVWMILSFSFYLTKYLNKDFFRRCVEYLSYASMSLYLFHRFFYYVSLKPFESIKSISVVSTLLYLSFIVFPLGSLLSYEIQRKYDKGIKMIMKTD